MMEIRPDRLQTAMLLRDPRHSCVSVLVTPCCKWRGCSSLGTETGKDMVFKLSKTLELC